MSHPQKTIANALAEPGAELGTSEADSCGKVKIEGKAPVIASMNHQGKSRVAQG